MVNPIVLEDKRSQCLSVLITTSAKKYLDFVEAVYIQRGGIEGQRAPLKTKTGQRIRKRMVEDIKAGSILPPIVIGAVLKAAELETAKRLNTSEEFEAFIADIGEDQLSIIDGMQRTTAIMDALKEADIASHPVRIELWLAANINSLIYRMLVLNTGQVPWDMQRQLQTVYQPILAEIKASVPEAEVFLVDDPSRRSQSGQYRGSKLIEYFLVFSSRKVHVDIKEKVAEDFARLDATEATSHSKFLSHFINSLQLMVQLDRIFSKCQPIADEEPSGKIKGGKDIFTSAPAGIGFMAASAVLIYGHPGFPTNADSVASANMEKLDGSVKAIVDLLDSKGPTELLEFLDLSGLNERLGRKSGKVGEFEREFYYKAFVAMFEYSGDLISMEPCWAAY